MLVAQPRLLSAVLILMAVLAMPVSAQSPAPAPDLPALTIVPADLDQSGWLHQGAYVHSIADAARDRADYIGQGADADEVTERLTSIGWQREYINFLSHPSGSDPTQPDQITRSYVTQYTGEEGARAGFEYLEDESKVTAAKDLPLDRAYGQQAELTSESGFSTQTGRQFRSLDLTFRMGALIAGVNIIQYPTAKRVDPDIDLLTSLAWPGNVRELQNLMEHLAVLADAGSVIQPDDLPARGDAASVSNGTRSWPAHLMSKAYHPAKEAVLAHFEKEYLSSLVARADRNMSKAARLAGIDRTTLYRLLDKHAIESGGRPNSAAVTIDPVEPPPERARLAD